MFVIVKSATSCLRTTVTEYMCVCLTDDAKPARPHVHPCVPIYRELQREVAKQRGKHNINPDLARFNRASAF